MDGSIKIKIGAVADRSIDAVFGSVEKRALKARDNISKNLGASGGTALGKPFVEAAKQADSAVKQIDKSWAQQSRAMLYYVRLQDREVKRSAQERVKAEAAASRAIVRNEAMANKARLRDEAETNRAVVREFKKQVREREQQTKRSEREDVRTRRNFAERTSHRATRFLFPAPSGILSAAGRLGGDILRGAGIDLSVAGGVSRAVGLQSGGVQLANQERIATGQSRGASFYAGLARDTGAARSIAPDQVMGMMSSFTAKTGDFNGVAKIADRLASLSTASGANLVDMGDAAGYVYNQLSALPDAGERTIEVMRGIIGQTAVGAVDMPDYAKQLGRIAANANKFEGDTGTNIRKMSALAQLAIESGGASSPADAARAVGSFANTFGKGPRINAFKKAGVELFTDKSQTTLRDPFEVIKDSFRKTKGNIPQLANMFADTLGRKPITALGNAYKMAGGGEAGIAAIEAKYNKYMSAQLTADVEKKNNADFANSPAAKAQRFQNNLDKVMASAAEKVFPALEKLAPQALALASALGKLTGYVAENPVQAIVLALVAAIGRAGLESALRSAIESRIMGSSSGLLPGRGLGADGNPLAGGTPFWGTRAGRGLMALGAGATGYAVGGALGGLAGGEDGQRLGSWTLGGMAAGAQYGGLPGAMIGATAGAVGSRVDDLSTVTEGWGGLAAGVGGLFSKGSFFEGVNEYQNSKAKQRRMVEDGATGAANQPPVDAAAFSRGVADGMSARTLSVKVVNAKDFATPTTTGPRVDSAGRAPK